MISSELPVYKDTVQYIKEICNLQVNFPRDFKHTIGQQWIMKAIGLPGHIIRANMFPEERTKHLSEYICDFEFCKIVTLLAGENKWIGRNKMANLLYMEGGIGKQVTAWKNWKPRKKAIKPKNRHEHRKRD